MEVIVDGLNMKGMIIEPATTIETFKNRIADFLGDRLNNYEIRLVFNDGQQLAPEIFTTNSYDKFDFKGHINQLQGSKLYINRIPNKTNNNNVYVFVNLENAEAPFAATTIEAALREWLDNYEDEDEIKEIMEVDHFDLSDETTQNSLIEYMRDNRTYLFTVPIIN